MKKLTLLTAAALACCTFSSANAQVQIIRSGRPTPAPRLVSDQTAASPRPLTDSGADAAIPNPFDYFNEQPPAAELYRNDASPFPSNLLEDDANQVRNDFQSLDANELSPSDSDPASLPVGRRHLHHPSVADTIVDQAALENIANASVVPVFWGGAPTTPNPVADWLMREDCVQGLWANYPQQRAAECALMWNRIAGHPCGCSHGNCHQATGPCSVCCGEPKIRNRYTERRLTAPSGCSTCDQSGLSAGLNADQPAASASPASSGTSQNAVGFAPPRVRSSVTGTSKLAQLPQPSAVR